MVRSPILRSGLAKVWFTLCTIITTLFRCARPIDEVRMPRLHFPPCGRIARRTFLADLGFGATGLALGALLQRQSTARGSEIAARLPTGQPHFPAKAKNVIWIFLSGGSSQLETFDP